MAKKKKRSKVNLGIILDAWSHICVVGLIKKIGGNSLYIFLLLLLLLFSHVVCTFRCLPTRVRLAMLLHSMML